MSNILEVVADMIETDQDAQLFRAICAALDAEDVYHNTILADSPIAYWKMTEPSGATLVDAIGAAHNGSYVGAPTLAQPGPLLGCSDTSVLFNGTVSQYAEVPYAAALNPAIFSAEAWAYPTGGAGTQRQVMVSVHNGGAGDIKGFFFEAFSTDTWNGVILNGTGFIFVAGSAIILNAWVHLVLTYDGTTMRWYNNGASVGSIAGTYVQNPDTVLRLAAGSGVLPGPPVVVPFPGRIGQAAIYNTCLSPTQVQTHYTAGRAASSGNLVQIRRIGQAVADTQLWPKLAGSSMVANDEILVARVGSGYVVLDKISR